MPEVVQEDQAQSLGRKASYWRQALRRRVLNWFGAHARDLPWRRTSDPYRVWVSEVMLQQTQVATVVSYYERFVARFPNVETLARANEREVLKLWEGLGYYRRARQLHRTAKQVVENHGGEFPSDFESVLSLPGIGRYTAGAILSIAFDQRHPILEANTIRLLSRLVASREDPASSAGTNSLWRLAEDLLPRKKVGDFNQALMELGSEICSPRSPKCAECPVSNLCEVNRLGLQTEIPAAKTKTNYENVNEVAVVVWRGNRVLLRQCREDERWAGLWDFLRFGVSDSGNRRRTFIAKTVADWTGGFDRHHR
ncbi:MAG: A/G-specific adenine glycosylase [Planctomycetes bacterium]|nr:A/G-specific adenine glycosylase [Planctomycetota bacterium]